MLALSVLGKQRVDVALSYDLEVAEKNLENFYNAIERLKNQEPIQYIIGETEFYGLPFIVNDSVLIPRPETEELVQWIIEDLKKIKIKESDGLNLIDIGTGSGCIAVSLAKSLPEFKVYGLDVSEKALGVAKNNAIQNNVSVDFIEADVLNWISPFKKQRFNIIVSNPPYVREIEKHGIKDNVLKYEPHVSLFVNDDDSLLFYRKIVEIANQILTPNGLIYFEINEYLGDEMINLLNGKGFVEIELKQDIYKKNRMIKGLLS